VVWNPGQSNLNCLERKCTMQYGSSRCLGGLGISVVVLFPSPCSSCARVRLTTMNLQYSPRYAASSNAAFSTQCHDPVTKYRPVRSGCARRVPRLNGRWYCQKQVPPIREQVEQDDQPTSDGGGTALSHFVAAVLPLNRHCCRWHRVYGVWPRVPCCCASRRITGPSMAFVLDKRSASSLS